MKRLYYILLVCTMANSTFAQQRQVDDAIQGGENMLGAYTIYPNMGVKKLISWFSNHSEWMLVDSVRTAKYKEFGFIKDKAVQAYFIPASKVDEYRTRELLFKSLEAGNIKQMIFAIEKKSSLEISNLFKEKIAKRFAENYQKSIEIHQHGGVYTHTAGSQLISTKFYRHPSNEEKTLAEDMKRFLTLRPDCRENMELKKAAFEYTHKVKDGDFLYYYDIFHDYCDMSADEINRFDNKTFQMADTKETLRHYLKLFPEGKHVTEANELLAGGLYNRQVGELENIIQHQLAVIKNLNGFGLSQDIVVAKGLVSSFWSAVFGANMATTLYHADSQFENYWQVAKNFQSDFELDDSRNKMFLASQVLDYLTVIDGLWAGDVQLAQSKKMLGGLWTVNDSWEGYVEDYSDDGLFKRSECAETPKCREIRVRIENAMRVLKRIEAEDRSGSRKLTIFDYANLHLAVKYDILLSNRDLNIAYCKLSHEESRRRWYAEQCAKCRIDWKKTLEEDHKIVMENGTGYEYTYDGQWRVSNLFWFDSKYDSYEEMLMRFLEECAQRFCKK